jgi:hypothetical protein
LKSDYARINRKLPEELLNRQIPSSKLAPFSEQFFSIAALGRTNLDKL